jgi:aspartyl aminopeptidase
MADQAQPQAQARDLLAYIDASPSPFHAVEETSRRLELAGFVRVDERDAWQLEPGARAYLVRDGGSIAAFEIGTSPPEEVGVRLIGAHTDSPTLRIKPQPEVVREGYRQLAVEVYGGALYSTWLDRDLSIAGRVVLQGEGATVNSQLVRLDDLLIRVPNLAIHLNRGVNDSLQLNAQQHLVPVVGLGDRAGFALRERIVSSLARGLAHARFDRSRAPEPLASTLSPECVLGWDLSLFAVEPSRIGGLADEFLFAPRLDNLSSCHAALTALIESTGPRAQTRAIVLFDHEEVGSQSARGAGSLMLRSLLSRVLEVFGPASETRLTRTVARSFLISGDMAHGVHPNYADRHEPGHRPLLGQGPVIKLNSNQGYGTDGETWALIEQLAASVASRVQRFVVRSDLGCGSTIGPISAARLGIRTVDLGTPMLSMHSAREMAAVADVEPMIRLLRAFLSAA